MVLRSDSAFSWSLMIDARYLFSCLLLGFLLVNLSVIPEMVPETDPVSAFLISSIIFSLYHLPFA